MAKGKDTLERNRRNRVIVKLNHSGCSWYMTKDLRTLFYSLWGQLAYVHTGVLTESAIERGDEEACPF